MSTPARTIKNEFFGMIIFIVSIPVSLCSFSFEELIDLLVNLELNLILVTELRGTLNWPELDHLDRAMTRLQNILITPNILESYCGNYPNGNDLSSILLRQFRKETKCPWAGVINHRILDRSLYSFPLGKKENITRIPNQVRAVEEVMALISTGHDLFRPKTLTSFNYRSLNKKHLEKIIIRAISKMILNRVRDQTGLELKYFFQINENCKSSVSFGYQSKPRFNLLTCLK